MDTNIMNHSTCNLITNNANDYETFGRKALNYEGQQAREAPMQENLELAVIPLFLTNACDPIKNFLYAVLYIITLHSLFEILMLLAIVKTTQG
jgi:hypothetical protein